VTKRIYGQKRTKKQEPPTADVDKRASLTLSDAPTENLLTEAQNKSQSAPMRSGKKRRSRQSADDQITCQMGKFRRLWRVLGFVLMLGLDIGIIGGDAAGGIAYGRLSWQREAISLVLLTVFNVLVLFPIIFEVWQVKADKDKIELKTMLWRATKPWDQVTDFKNPIYMKLSMLSTGRAFYLLNKNVLPDYPILESIILRYWRAPKRKRLR